MDTKTEFVFRSAFHGYNREDVNQYILNMSRRFKEAQDASKEKIEQLTAQLSAQEPSIVSVTGDGRTAALEEEIRRLTEENKRLKQSAAVGAQDSSMSTEPFDNLSQQIGSILMSANSTASTILSNASSDAEKLRADAESEVNKVKTRLGAEADTILAKFSAELKEVLEMCLSELNIAVNEIQSETATIAADIQRKNRDMNERVDHYRAMMSDSLSAKLTELEKSFVVVKGSARTDRK